MTSDHGPARAWSGEIVGHRGAAGLAPENTLEGFETAIALGVDRIEFDVRRTSDGHAIVFHDATLDRFEGFLRRPALEGFVSDHPLATLRAIDVGAVFGMPGCHVPTLEETLSSLAGRVRTNVECKGAGSDGLLVLALCVRAIRDTGVADETILSSFHDDVLARSARDAPEIPRALIARAKRGDDLVEAAAAASCVALHVEHSLATPALLDRCRAAGLALRAWTVNAPQRMRQLAALGVDGIITDHPDRARAALGL